MSVSNKMIREIFETMKFAATEAIKHAKDPARLAAGTYCVTIELPLSARDEIMHLWGQVVALPEFKDKIETFARAAVPTKMGFVTMCVVPVVPAQYKTKK